MFVRVLAVTFALGLSDIASAQADTARVRLVPRVRVPDSARSRDVDTAQVLELPAIVGGMDVAKRRRMIDSLDAQRRIWELRRPRAYAIRVLSMSCIQIQARSRTGAVLRDHLLVQDTSIVRRQPVPIPAAYEQRCSLAWRVDDLFADLSRALDDTTAAVGVSYDPAYGFPRAYWISHGGADDGHEVLVESFAAARR